MIDSVVFRLLRTRAVVRAPIWLYRHRAGWLLGSRMLMLEHVGRRSGVPRYVCLEVVERPSEDEIVVVNTSRLARQDVDMTSLIRVGYWRSEYEPTLPDPREYLDETWDDDERELVVA
jgi:hypothetical protein